MKGRAPTERQVAALDMRGEQGLGTVCRREGGEIKQTRNRRGHDKVQVLEVLLPGGA